MVSGTTRCDRTNHLVQRDVRKPIDAMKLFNAQVRDGQIPIVLTPTDPIVMTVFMKIPSGLYVTRFGKNAGVVFNDLLLLFAGGFSSKSGMLMPG